MATSSADLSALVQIELGELADSLTQQEINRSINKAMNELGYSYPIIGLYENWAINRSKRHAIEILVLTESPNFKFNKLSLEQSFEHLVSMLKYFDAEFATAIENQPELFPNLSWSTNPSGLFGTYIPNGFRYDKTGRDISFYYIPVSDYDFTPTEE